MVSCHKGHTAEQQGTRIRIQMCMIPEYLCLLSSALLSPLNSLLGGGFTEEASTVQGLVNPVSLWLLISTVNSM